MVFRECDAKDARKGKFMQTQASVIGHFGIGKQLLNGQTIKTKIITEELKACIGEEQVLTIDTYGGWKTLIKAPLQVFRALKFSCNIIILPAHNGLRVFAPLLVLLRTFFKKRRLHYIVIGGWLPEFLKNRRVLANVLRHFDYIYVETGTMKTKLESQGFNNICILPNCKKLTIISESDLVYSTEYPLKLCTFSRVVKEKGIEDAVKAVMGVNDKLGYTGFALDIFGQIDAGQEAWFDELKSGFPDYVRYMGEVPCDKSVEVLKNYFALLFPTRCFTEGTPGTIIDAYAAGLPVISAKWESFADVVENGVTGIGYEFDESSQLANILFSVSQGPQKFIKMKINCLQKAKEYVPKDAICTLRNNLQ